MAQKQGSEQDVFGNKHHGKTEREMLLHVLHHLDHQEKHLVHQESHLVRLEAALARTEKAAGLIEGFAERIELPLQRAEQVVDLIAEAATRLEKQIMALAEDLAGVDTKIDAFTTDMGNVIDSAVARIVAEIQKQGVVPPEVQAALDHLSLTADNLQAFKASSAQKIIDAGQVPVPPMPDPIPVPVEPVMGRGRH